MYNHCIKPINKHTKLDRYADRVCYVVKVIEELNDLQREEDAMLMKRIADNPLNGGNRYGGTTATGYKR
jgi:hypothetical protein